jgi:hypothetical protein
MTRPTLDGEASTYRSAEKGCKTMRIQAMVIPMRIFAFGPLTGVICALA